MEKLTQEQKMKDKFVEHLGYLLSEYKINNIDSMEYFVDDLGDEFVRIFYKNKIGTNENYSCDFSDKIINVSLDSLGAIVKDICKQGGLD